MDCDDSLRPKRKLEISLSQIAKFEKIRHFGPDAIVSGVAVASSDVCSGDLFVGLQGAHRHGAEFVSDALASGATAILTDSSGLRKLPDTDIPALIVENPREVLGQISCLIYGRQSGQGPKIFGVTGTNGKTSTAFLLEAMIRGLGKSTALSTTAHRQVRGVLYPSSLTTPESPDLHAMAARAAEENVWGIAIEISAQALEQNRLDELSCDVAGFTNLSHDHFEDFGSMDRYLRAKAALFRPEKAKSAVVCVDSIWGQKLAELSEVPLVKLGRGDELFDWNYRIIESTPRETIFELTARDLRSVVLKLPAIGVHMVANAALAAVMLIESGVRPTQLVSMGPDGEGIPVFIPGRMEKVSGQSGPALYVDAGRSADAYQHTLSSLRENTVGNLIMVCGTSGNRDKSKRPIMGRVAADLADIVIVTDDDPRLEDPSEIRKGLLSGAREIEKSEVYEVPDPSEAIRFAVSLAKEGDTVLWTGPGSQDYRDIGEKIPFSARVVARQALLDAGWEVDLK